MNVQPSTINPESEVRRQQGVTGLGRSLLDMKIHRVSIVAAGILCAASACKGAEADLGAEIKGLRASHVVTQLLQRQKELNRIHTKVERKVTDEERAETEKLRADLGEEHARRIKLYDKVREGAKLREYPGLLEKVWIDYRETLRIQRKVVSKIYRMCLWYDTEEEGDAILLIYVDLDGTVIKKDKYVATR